MSDWLFTATCFMAFIAGAAFGIFVYSKTPWSKNLRRDMASNPLTFSFLHPLLGMLAMFCAAGSVFVCVAIWAMVGFLIE